MDINRRHLIATVAGTGASLILPGRTEAAPKLQPSVLPIGTIVATMDSTYDGHARYRILADGDYWLPLWLRGYFLSVHSFPVLFSIIGYSHGRRDHYGPEFSLPYYDPNFEFLKAKADSGYVAGVPSFPCWIDMTSKEIIGK